MAKLSDGKELIPKYKENMISKLKLELLGQNLELGPVEYLRPRTVQVTVELGKDGKTTTIPDTINELERAMFAVGAEEVEIKGSTYRRESDKVTSISGQPSRVLQYRLQFF